MNTVVIVRVPRDAAVIARIRAELEANDLRVHELGPDSNSARAPLASLVNVTRARAALRMQPDRSAIELWVASEGDAAGGGEVVVLPGGERDEALLALRATEALRARGLRLPRRAEPAGSTPGAVATAPAAVSAAASGTPSTTGSGPEEQKAAEAAARAVAERAEKERLEKERQEKERLEKERLEKERAAQEAAEEEAEAEEEEDGETDEPEAETSASEAAEPADTSLLYVELGPAMAASLGDASPMWAGWANVRLQPAALWSISAFGFVPFAGGTYESNEGTGHLRSYMVGLSADIHGAYRGLGLSAGVGGAALITSIGGESSDMFQLASETELTGAAMARIGLSVSLSQHFRLGARGILGFAIPELKALVSPSPVTWGRPFVLAAIALEFALPEPER